MRAYAPERWEIVEVGLPSGNAFHKILGSWYGGFGGSDEWRFSSGIEKIIDKGTHWEIPNSSGSVYTCYKNDRGMSAYTGRVWNQFQTEAEESQHLGHLKIVPIDSILEMYT
jgi:hypothetical protein